jgi:hypothetical protein
LQVTNTALAVVLSGLFGFIDTSSAAKMDVIIGHWHLNVSKSEFSTGPGLKKLDTNVIDAGNGKYTYRFDWIDGEGVSGYLQFTAALNGRPASVTGYAGIDTATITRIDSERVQIVYLSNGNEVERRIQSFSPDGKTIHEVDTGVNDNGNIFKDQEVFERQ